MGWVRRPCLPSQWSDCRESSATECRRKKSGVTRRVVASSAMAFTPFSQNSATERCESGSGQAQPGQSKPPFWLICVRTRSPRIGPISSSAWRMEETTAGAPAATSGTGPTRIPVNASGGCAFTPRRPVGGRAGAAGEGCFGSMAGLLLDGEGSRRRLPREHETSVLPRAKASGRLAAPPAPARGAHPPAGRFSRAAPPPSDAGIQPSAPQGDNRILPGIPLALHMLRTQPRKILGYNAVDIDRGGPP